jgi:hypothetical protein
VEAHYKDRAWPVNLRARFLAPSRPCAGNAAWTRA